MEKELKWYELNKEFFDLFNKLTIELEDYPWYFNIPEIIVMLDELRKLAEDLKPTKESTSEHQ